MATVQVLSAAEQSRIRKKVEEFANLDEEGSLMPYVFEENMSDGDVEVRFFPTPEEGPVEGLFFEISVHEHADWYDDSLGAYSADNLRNGGPLYEALASELEEAVRGAIGKHPEFVMSKGSGVFSWEVSL